MVKNLKKLRQKAQISQQLLAEKIGTSQQSINKYENHKIEPDISTLIAIADLFETTVDYLIGRTDENSNKTNKTSADIFLEKYLYLNDSEKKCVEVLIDTFIEQKKQK